MLNSFLFLVKTSIKPTYITKNENIGFITLVVASANLNTSCAKEGDIFARITDGIMLGAIIDHFATEPGRKILHTMPNIKINKIRGTNENSEEEMTFDKRPVITTPRLVSVTKAFSWAAKKIKTKTPPMLFK